MPSGRGSRRPTEAGPHSTTQRLPRPGRARDPEPASRLVPLPQHRPPLPGPVSTWMSWTSSASSGRRRKRTELPGLPGGLASALSGLLLLACMASALSCHCPAAPLRGLYRTRKCFPLSTSSVGHKRSKPCPRHQVAESSSLEARKLGAGGPGLEEFPPAPVPCGGSPVALWRRCPFPKPSAVCAAPLRSVSR